MDVAPCGFCAGSRLALAERAASLAAVAAAVLLCGPVLSAALLCGQVVAADSLLSPPSAADSPTGEPYMLWPFVPAGRPLATLPTLDQPSGKTVQDDWDEMLRLPSIDQTDPAPGANPWSLPPAQDVSLANFVQDANREATATTGGGKPEGPEALGKAPASNTLQFLRRQTVLLAPGQHQFDIGISYALFNSDFPLPVVNTPGGPIVNVLRERIRQRVFLIPTELRYGLTDRVQGFFDLPVGWANSELSYSVGQNHSDIVGLGDVRAGFSTLVRQGCGGDSPDIILTLAGVAPTGNPGNPLLTGINTGNRLGQGFWQFQTNLLFVHTYDPLVVFYGVGYVHRCGADIAGNYFQAGEEFDYQCGVGFAVNPTCTVSGSFAGAYIGQWQVNNQPLLGSTLEIQRMRFALTMVKDRRIVEPFAEIGMTVYSPTSRVGITWTF